MSSRPSLGYWLLFIVINIAISALTTWFVVRQLMPAASPLSASALATSRPAIAITATPQPTAGANASADGTPVNTVMPIDNEPAATSDSTVATPAEPTTTPAPASTNGTRVRISAVIYPGQPSREVVVVVNESGDTNLTDWTIVSPRGKIFTFGNLTLYKDSFINVYSRNGTNTATDLFWNQTLPMWQAGDEVQLKQGDQVVATYTVK